MSLDLLLILASVVFTVLSAAVGVEMANNPPTTRNAKWGYRLAFVLLGLLLVGSTVWQGRRNLNEQTRIAKEALNEKLIGDARYNQLQGKLENITQFVAHPPAGFSSEQITAAVRAMAKNTAKPTSQQVQQLVTQAPYGNLAARCTELGDAIIATMNWRATSRPDPTVNLQGYKEWYRLNDGLYFHAPYYPHAAQIRKELADLHVDDPRLDELMERHERDFALRQQNVQAATDKPEMFHLSIEELKEIGERFKFLATQIPH